MPRGETHLHVSSFFHVLTSRHCQPSGYQVLSTFHYKQARNSLSTPSAAPLWVHFTVIFEFNSVISLWLNEPTQAKNAQKNLVWGLSQPSYAFVSDMSIRRNTSQRQARQTCTQARQTNHNSLVAIFLLPAPQKLPSPDLEWRVTPLRTNQRSQ